MSKYKLLMEALGTRGLAGHAVLNMPEPAPASWLKLAHAAGYVDQVLACEVPEKIEREIGFPVARASRSGRSSRRVAPCWRRGWRC